MAPKSPTDRDPGKKETGERSPFFAHHLFLASLILAIAFSHQGISCFCIRHDLSSPGIITCSCCSVRAYICTFHDQRMIFAHNHNDRGELP